MSLLQILTYCVLIPTTGSTFATPSVLQFCESATTVLVHRSGVAVNHSTLCGGFITELTIDNLRRGSLINYTTLIDNERFSAFSVRPIVSQRQIPGFSII